jgi:hydrogenase maturation protein HypF
MVSELRRRKARDDKPFALMVANVALAETLCVVAPAERELLQSPRRPIVLLRRRSDTPVAGEVAPGNPFLGVMLPYTPLHHLLLNELQGMPLVMTSGNRSDEPIAFEDAYALERLAAIADLFVTHNRPIHLRCDDSVTRVVADVEMPVRRSRGWAPQPLRLPFHCLRPTLAVGGQWKSTFALGRDRHAFLSHHLGDLDHYEAYRAYTEAIDHYERLFSVRPEQIIHDAHPDYASTRYALERAAGDEIETLAVQHHHAHMASCMAEHGLDEQVIGVIFDGTGYGMDGAIWGGEFLLGDYRGFRRVAHLRYVPMPGGDQAIRESWRMAVTYLLEAGLDPDTLDTLVPKHCLGTPRHSQTEFGNEGLAGGGVRMIARMIERGFNSPPTSSAGRLFDAVAALIGLRQKVSYEGQAAMELEAIAATMDADHAYPSDLIEAPPSAARSASKGLVVIDTRPLIATIASEAENGVEPARIARRFHSTVVEIIAAACCHIRQETGIETVVLSGGVFLNALLTQEVPARLGTDGFRVYRHESVPPSDGGLCLGQLAIAAAVQQSRPR